jgi:hypothetical protein
MRIADVGANDYGAETIRVCADKHGLVCKLSHDSFLDAATHDLLEHQCADSLPLKYLNKW